MSGAAVLEEVTKFESSELKHVDYKEKQGLPTVEGKRVRKLSQIFYENN